MENSLEWDATVFVLAGMKCADRHRGRSPGHLRPGRQAGPGEDAITSRTALRGWSRGPEQRWADRLLKILEDDDSSPEDLRVHAVKFRWNACRKWIEVGEPMLTATVEQVQADLLAVIAKLRPGEELLITKEDRPIARLVAEPAKREAKREIKRQPGSSIGILSLLHDDDAPLDDFRDLLP